MKTDTKNLLEQLRWRYAAKKFDNTKQIPAAEWKALEEALVLTPSSYGLQPWKFFVVTKPELKEKLVPLSWNQRQVGDASHVVVFAIKKDVGEKDIDRYLQRMQEVRGIPAQALEKFRSLLINFTAKMAAMNPPQIDDWAVHQVYIALGNFMTSAAMIGIDTCPMEGIQPEKYDELLGLTKQGYKTVVVCVAGYRAADDKYAPMPKVRFKTEEVIQPL